MLTRKKRKPEAPPAPVETGLMLLPSNIVDMLIKMAVTSIRWHCYLCGYYWPVDDRANSDKINPEKPPDYCANCKRENWRDEECIGTHDPDCVDCVKKREKILADVNKLLKKINAIK